jgi:hypothetical protein
MLFAEGYLLVLIKHSEMDEFRAFCFSFSPHFHLMVHRAQIVCFEVYGFGSTVYLVQLCVGLVDWRCSQRRLQTWVVYQVG